MSYLANFFLSLPPSSCNGGDTFPTFCFLETARFQINHFFDVNKMVWNGMTGDFTCYFGSIVNDQAWRNDKKSPCKLFALRSAHRVDRLPGNEHGHDGGLPRAGRQLQS